MATPFIMPKMDMDQETVVINEWLKKEGELVEKGEPVIIIETDKITSEVEAPASGRLARVLYKDNDEVPVTKVVAYILAEGETEADLPAEPSPSATKEEKPAQQATPELISENVQRVATPVAKRMAEAKQIDLEHIPSQSDKITKEDVEAYLESLTEAKPRVQVPATPAARRFATDEGISLSQVQGTGPRGRVQAKDVASFAAKPAEAAFKARLLPSGTLPLSRIRKIIGERLTASYQSTPHIYLSIEADMFEAEQSRKRMNALAVQSNETSISMTAYLVRVVAWALKRHPLLNASLQNEEIKIWEDVNIGIATAIDEGLIVPVIHQADQKTIREINQQLRTLTEQARKGSLPLEAVQGGTFSVSNLGMYGVQSFTAIINPPQVAILAVGAVTRKPVVVDESDSVQVRPMMMMTLAADHRVIDGAIAAEFLADLTGALETPEVMLM